MDEYSLNELAERVAKDEPGALHELLKRIKRERIKGEEVPAFECLWKLFCPRFVGHACNRGLQAADADAVALGTAALGTADAVALETMERVWNGIPGYREDVDRAAGWLWQICNNAINDHFRQLAAQQRLEEEARRMPPAADAPSERGVYCWELVLSSLSEEERELYFDVEHRKQERIPGRRPRGWRELVRRIWAAYKRCMREE